MQLNKKELEKLETFVYKVSMEGFNYALRNYGPKSPVFKKLYELSALNSEDFLEELMEEHGIEFS